MALNKETFKKFAIMTTKESDLKCENSAIVKEVKELNKASAEVTRATILSMKFQAKNDMRSKYHKILQRQCRRVTKTREAANEVRTKKLFDAGQKIMVSNRNK